MASLTDELDLRFGAGVLDSEVDSQFADYDGNSLPNAPESQVTATLRYETALASGYNLILTLCENVCLLLARIDAFDFDFIGFQMRSKPVITDSIELGSRSHATWLHVRQSQGSVVVFPYCCFKGS